MRCRAQGARAIRVMWRKFIVAAAVAVPLLYLAMGHMIPALKFPFPFFLDPMRSPLVFALAQLILVIPAIVAGNRFYRIGGKALWHRAPNMDSLIAIGTSAAVPLQPLFDRQDCNGRPRSGRQSLLRSGAVINCPHPVGKTLETVSKGARRKRSRSSWVWLLNSVRRARRSGNGDPDLRG